MLASLLQSAVAQAAAIADGAVRAGPIAGIPQLLRELGQDPDAVFTAVGCDHRLLDAPENPVPFTLIDRLLDTCVEITDCPHFGLLLGQRVGLDGLGLVGMVARHSPTVKEALSNIALYLHLHDRGAVPALTVVDGTATLSYTIYQPDMMATAPIYDFTAAISYNGLRTLCGPRWQPNCVRLPRARPGNPAPYRRHFGLLPTFDTEQLALVFAADWLERPVHGADPALYSALREHAEALSREAYGDLVPRARRIACNLLLQGSGSLDSAAAALSMHPRTLNRRLQESGTTYRQLCEECRNALAHQFLLESRLPIAEIAGRLQYNNTTAFIRAFRRWNGTTPSAWRTAHRYK